MDDLNAAAQPAEAATKAALPGILAAVGWIVLYFVILQGISIAIATGVLLGWDKVGNQSAMIENPVALLYGMASASLILLAIFAVYLRRDNRAVQIGLTHNGSMKLQHTLALAAISIFAAMAFNAAYARFIIPGVQMQGDYALMASNLAMTFPNISMAIFVVAIAAPFIEEVLFRGFLQRSLTTYLPIWAAILISSFGFSLMHGQLYAIPGLMSLSLAFGYIYHRTGSLRINIILHVVNNTLTLLAMQSAA